MPEQLTKHPEVTLQVLRSAGAKCAEGSAQEILTQCPRERFCKLPGGEICVYGLPEAPQMTQVTAADWRALASIVLPRPSPSGDLSSGEAWLGGGIGLLAGALIGIAVMRARNRRR